MAVTSIDPTNYLAALKAATAGDVLVLADGDYPAASITAKWTIPVTLTPQNAGGARVGKVTMTGATGVTFAGLHLVGGTSCKNGCRDITIRDCLMDDMAYFLSASRVTVAGCTINATKFGLLLNSVQHFTVRQNTIRRAGEDVLRITGNSFNGVVEFNDLLDTASVGATHPDFIQLFGQRGVTPHDLVIRGNHIWEDPTTGRVSAQGIFMTDAQPDMYRNVLIEDNLIAIGSPNTIALNGCKANVVVRNNTLMMNAQDGGATIRLGARKGYGNAGAAIYNNVVQGFYDQSKDAQIGVNYVYGRKADRAALFQGDGSQRAHFVPPPGSPIGAQFGAWQA